MKTKDTKKYSKFEVKYASILTTEKMYFKRQYTNLVAGARAVAQWLDQLVCTRLI